MVALLVGTLLYVNKTNLGGGQSDRRERGLVQVAARLKSADLSHHAKVKQRSGQSSYLQKGLSASGARQLGQFSILTSRTTSLQGKVQGENGIGIAGAAVTAWSGIRSSKTKTTNVDGTFQFRGLEDSTTWLTAKADGFAPTAWGEHVFLLPMPDLDDPIIIELDQPVKLTGKVIDEKGRPLASAKVAVVKMFDDQMQIYNGDTDHIGHGGYGVGQREHATATAGKDGRFALDNLKPGYVSLHIEHQTRPGIIAEEICADSKGVQIVLDRGVTLEGRVLDGATPVAGAAVTVSGGVEGFTGISGTSATVVTDMDGSFTVEGLQVVRSDMVMMSFTAMAKTSSSVKIPSYLFSIMKDQGTCNLVMNSTDIDKVDSSNGVIDIRSYYSSRNESYQFGDSQLEGSVKIPGGLSEKIMMEAQIQSSVLIDKIAVTNGHFEFKKLPSGRYSVSIRVKNPEDIPNQVAFVPQRVEVRQGELHTVIIEPGTATIKGKVLDTQGLGNLTVEIYAIDRLSPFFNDGWNSGFIASQTVNSTGEFEIRGLVPGKYQVVVAGMNVKQAREVVCRAGETAYCEIRPSRLLKITGRIRRSDNKSLGRIQVAFDQAVGGRVETDETDSKGRFGVYLTTGTYSMLVQPRGMIHPEVFKVDIREGKTSIPVVKLNEQPASGIIVKQTGVPYSMWRAAEFDLVEMDAANDRLIITKAFPAAKTGNSITLSGLAPGNYGLVIRCGNLDNWPNSLKAEESQPFATAWIPNINVAPKAFSVVSVPLEAGFKINLVCHPAGRQAAWSNPKFWIKDNNDITMPLILDRNYCYMCGLVPGEYSFGVTLDSGKEQSIAFRVAPGDVLKEVVLDLR